MAVNATTLTGDVTNNALTLSVASITGATVGRKIRVNNEMIGAIIEVIGLSVKIRGRGDSGTIGEAHKASSPVLFGDDGDFPEFVPGRTVQVPPEADQDFYSVDGAIALPNGMRNTTAVLTKATAGAYTLAAPSASQDGVRLSILSSSAAAHVVTATALLQDGLTGGPHGTATFAAFLGANVELQALKGTWHVVAKNVVTIT